MNGWSETQKFLAGDGAAQDRFGVKLAIEGDTALVSAPEDDNAAGNNAGAVYVFKRANGTFSQTQKLASSDLRANDNFGIFGLGLSGNTAVMSAIGADIGQSSNQGALYVFERHDSSSNFVQMQKLTAMDRQPGDNLADAITLQGDTLVASATFAQIGGNDEH